MSLTNRDIVIVSQITEAINYLSNEFINPVYLAQNNEYIYYSGDEIPDFIEIAKQIVKNLLNSILKVGNDNCFTIEFNNCLIKCFLYNFDYGIKIVKYIEVKIQN